MEAARLQTWRQEEGQEGRQGQKEEVINNC
jgi:hypothetical protein